MRLLSPLAIAGLDSADLVTTSFGGFFGFRAALAAPSPEGMLSARWPSVGPAGTSPKRG